MAKRLHPPGPIVAVIGSESLLGKEVRDLLEDRHPKATIRLIVSSDSKENILTEEHGEVAVIAPLGAEQIAASKLVLLAGGPETSRKAWELALAAARPPRIVDASGALDDVPEARLCAPMVQPSEPPSPLQVVAHPAAIVLALLLRKLRGFATIRRSVIQIFEPASERGQRGLDELQQQTVGLLSFQKLKKAVYDAQVSFNLLPAYGEDAPQSLNDIETTIDRHLASLLASSEGIPMPSLHLVQAPVFHGYSFSVWVEFEEIPDIQALERSLAGPHIEVRKKDEEPPSNVGATGQSGITVGAISADRNQPRACWLWVVADNLRIVAENAVEVSLAVLA